MILGLSWMLCLGGSVCGFFGGLRGESDMARWYFG